MVFTLLSFLCSNFSYFSTCPWFSFVPLPQVVLSLAFCFLFIPTSSIPAVCCLFLLFLFPYPLTAFFAIQSSQIFHFSINCLKYGMNSIVTRLMDNTMLFWWVKTKADSEELQEDLSSWYEWVARL